MCILKCYNIVSITRMSRSNPSIADTRIFWSKSVNTVAAGALAPFITKSSAAMVLDV